MRRIVIAFAIALGLFPALSQAQTAPASVLSDAEIDARLNDLTSTLHEQQINAEYWEYGWGAFDAGTMTSSAINAGRERNRKDRDTNIVQAAESLIGLADVVFRPLPAFNADSVCNRPDGTELNRLQCLEAKEALLEESAARAHEPYELMPHLANLGFNLVAGLIVKRVADNHNALLTAIPGEVIGEIQLWTTPGQPMHDEQRYKLTFGPLILPANATQGATTGGMFSFHF